MGNRSWSMRTLMKPNHNLNHNTATWQDRFLENLLQLQNYLVLMWYFFSNLISKYIHSNLKVQSVHNSLIWLKYIYREITLWTLIFSLTIWSYFMKVLIVTQTLEFIFNEKSLNNSAVYCFCHQVWGVPVWGRLNPLIPEVDWHFSNGNEKEKLFYAFKIILILIFFSTRYYNKWP